LHVEDAEAIGALVPVGEPRPEKKATVFAFTYPPQQQKLGSSPRDPSTGWDAGDVVFHDTEARTLELKRGPKLDDVPLPTALIPGDVYST
jgi:hypothetical protein